MSAAFNRCIANVTAARQGFDRCCLALDSGPSFRKAVPEYKSNRKDRGEPYREQIRRTIERLAADGCVPLEAPAVGSFALTDKPSYAEADDVAGWFVEQYSERVKDIAEEEMGAWSCVLLSDDGDWEQLIDDAAGVYVLKSALRGSEKWNEAKVREERGGVTPAQIPDLKALMGDKGDNFKGYTGPAKERDPAHPDVDQGCNPGVGGGHAASLLKRYSNAIAIFEVAETPEGRAARWEADGVKPGIRAILERHGRAVAEKGLYLATIRRTLPVLDFAAVLAPPTVKTIAKNADYAMPPDEEAAPVAAPLAVVVRAESASLAARGIDVFALQPKGLQALESLAKTLYDSRLYGQYGNWQAIMAVAIEANERGIPVASAVRQAHVIQGKVGWPAAFLAGLILSSGKADIFELVSTDAQQATIRYKRKGRPEGTFQVTIENARADGQLDKWLREKKSVRIMLQWKCFREGARAMFPDVCSGMHEVDEIGGDGGREAA